MCAHGCTSQTDGRTGLPLACMDLAALPRDLYSHVASYLDVEAALALGCTCRATAALVSAWLKEQPTLHWECRSHPFTGAPCRFHVRAMAELFYDLEETGRLTSVSAGSWTCSLMRDGIGVVQCLKSLANEYMTRDSMPLLFIAARCPLVWQGPDLPSYGHLTEISLPGCGLGDTGASFVAHALHGDFEPDLVRLDLGQNDIGDFGASNLAFLVSHTLRELEKLDLSNNSITNVGVLACLDAIAEGPGCEAETRAGDARLGRLRLADFDFCNTNTTESLFDCPGWDAFREQMGWATRPTGWTPWEGARAWYAWLFP